MASNCYHSFIYDGLSGAINCTSDTFKAMLCTSAYTPNKDHAKRSDITNEVAAGNGYATGGVAVACTLSRDTANDKVIATFANPQWNTATITARYCIIYKSRGGNATADELVQCIDLGGDISSTAGTFLVNITQQLQFPV